MKREKREIFRPTKERLEKKGMFKIYSLVPENK